MVLPNNNTRNIDVSFLFSVSSRLIDQSIDESINQYTNEVQGYNTDVVK